MRSVTISVWSTLGSRYSDALMDNEVRSSENFVEDSEGTIMSLVPWSKANGGTLPEQKTRDDRGWKMFMFNRFHEHHCCLIQYHCIFWSPAQFVLAEILQYVCWGVVREVLHSVHGFVHGGDVFDCSHLLMLIMVHDVVHTTQTCPRDIDD